MDWQKAQEVSLEHNIQHHLDCCRREGLGSDKYDKHLDKVKDYANKYYQLTGRSYELKTKEIENEI